MITRYVETLVTDRRKFPCSGVTLIVIIIIENINDNEHFL